MLLHAAETGEGERPIVLLHGLFGSAQNFGALQRRLGEAARVIALDLRNHGDSPHADTMRYPEMARDVVETLRALRGLPCRLLGHSMGGKVAMQVALQSGGEVERLLVADIAPVRYPPAFRGFADAMQAVPLRPGLTRAAASAALADAIPDAAIRSFLLQNMRFGPQPAWRIGLDRIAAALPGIEGWEAPDAAPFAGPVLFVGGARSDYIQPQHRPAIRALFPQAQIVALKDAGHWLHADNPDGFLRLVAAFFGVRLAG
ncbi:MAG: alpha/beta fold hydrolase [Acetobacteraceae bacterium]|nr:alpha/beta fold hydrolase [Acetobacteraceae bacterium]